MSLKIYHANRIETLFAQLAVRLDQAPPGMGPLEGETVLLENPAMGAWVNLQLARLHGVAANIQYPRFSQFFWDLARVVVAEDIPEVTPLNKLEMTWRILAALQDPELMARPELAPVNQYLDRDDAGESLTALKRYQLAARVADLFDQYQVFRPRWIVDGWDRDEPAGTRREWSESWRSAEAWQRAIWRFIRVAGDGAPAPSRKAHRAGIHRALCNRLSGDFDPAILPFRRLSVFGVTALPESDLDVLMGLARHVDVSLYLFNPCEAHWCDIPTARQAIREEAARYRAGEQATGLPPELGNPLLAAQGQQVRDFLELVYRKSDEYQLAAGVEDHQAFTDPDPERDRGLLTAVHQDILELSFRGEIATLTGDEGEPLPLPAGETDGAPSIHFHNAHGPLREVEMLHDQLLDLFDRDPDLNPRDVVVMMPRVAPYVPCIKAVFERGAERGDGRRIDYHIADRTLVEESPVLNGFESLLKLPESRLPLSEVLGLLELPSVQRRFGLQRGDFESIRRWLIDAGVRWGRDAAHRQAETGAAFSEFSWAFGLDRMLSGYAMSADGDTNILGVQPLDDIEGGHAAAFDGFLRFWRRLEHYRELLARDRSPAAWASTLGGMLNDLFEPDDEDRPAFTELRRGLESLARAGESGWFTGTVPLDVVRAAIAPVLRQGSGMRHPFSEGVKFCSLLPMRGVPFKVVYLLGMNMEDYPRRIDRPGFDLMRDDYRAGDRSARIDDRWLFLEALLSARQAFHVSYIGQDMHRNEAREPSVVASELMDYLRDGYATDGFDEEGQLREGRLYTRHPLQPFSPSYFGGRSREDSRRFSLDPASWAIATEQATARGAGQDGEEPGVLRARWNAGVVSTETPAEVDLDDFIAFFTRPAKWFFRRHGVSLGLNQDQVEDEEMLGSGDGLAAWQRGNALLRRINQSPLSPDADQAAEKQRQIDGLVRSLQARGQWPMGSAGQHAAKKLDELGEPYLFFRAQAGPASDVAIRLEVPVAGTATGPVASLRITGTLPLHEAAYRYQSASGLKFKTLLDFYLRTAVLAGSYDGGLTEAWGVFGGAKSAADRRKLNGEYVGLRFDADFLADRRRHIELLSGLANLYLAHAHGGLPFHPELSAELVDLDPDEQRQLVRKKWYESGFGRDDSMRGNLVERAYYGTPEALLEPVFLDTSAAMVEAVNRWAKGGSDE
ncbi:exodeoxyribonuclease V subunit gamma [Marinihelvus fidelis]|uniref:RecBCD enzyme subunit RecC n=1 Tax=Marinihelvus fidelis TaxID=2613842 RepID=A0A5N0TAK6_9GAMM|nr:exodeoxyribonuclease V subunit gamma [Marinihelvus fidelis]KAA9131464.1 exodeoxyribonuclease V subunit gamma [Marinihelvus fidelis]